MRTAGAVLTLAAVAFAGAACGADTKDAAKTGTGDVAGIGRPTSGLPMTPTSATRSPKAKPVSPVVAQQASVNIGRFCSNAGTVARASDGKAATCTKTGGQNQPRWTAAPSGAAPAVTGNVGSGAVCSDIGAIGQFSGGKPATCAKQSSSQARRWAPAKSGTATIPGAVRPGAFCAPQETKGKTSQGVAYSCTKKSSDQQARWSK